MADEEVIPCDECSGSGECDSCDGGGDSPEQVWRKCPHCDGRYKGCDECSGMGGDYVWPECGACDGSGRCSECDGTGEVEGP